MTYRRPLSPFERLWIAAQTSCLCTLVEGQGNLSTERLRAAVDLASAANPGSRLVLKGIGPWAYWQETDVPPTVEEVDGRGWDGLGAANLPFSDRAHLDPKQAPSSSFVLVRGETPRLVLRTHHATMDALGALQFLQDVFRALRGEALFAAADRQTDLELARRLGGRSRRIGHACLNPFNCRSSGKSGSTWERVRVTCRLRPQPLAHLIRAIAHCAREAGTGPVLIDLPVNLRQQFPEIRSTANLTGSLRLAIAPGDSIADIAAIIATQVAASRHADALISAAPFRYLPLRLMQFAARAQARQAIARNTFSPSAVVSNVGRIDLASLSGDGFAATGAAIVPPAYDGVPLFVIFSGHDNGFDLTARAPLALGDDGRLRTLLEKLASALHSQL